MLLFIFGFFCGALASLFVFALCNVGERNLSSNVTMDEEIPPEEKIQTP